MAGPYGEPIAGGRYGYIHLAQQVAGASFDVAANAGFADTSGAPADCPVTQLGNGCAYVDCPAPLLAPAPSIPSGMPTGLQDAGGQADGGGSAPSSSAGSVTISGATIPAGLTLVPQSDGSYRGLLPDSPTAYFRGGDMILFTAQGAASSVGAFHATVPAPGDVVVSAPALAGGALTLARSKDLDVVWSGGTAGTGAYVYITTTSVPALEIRTVACTFAASSGEGTVPSAHGLENLFPTDGAGVQGFMSLTPLARNNVSVASNEAGADWTISLDVTGTSSGGAFITSD